MGNCLLSFSSFKMSCTLYLWVPCGTRSVKNIQRIIWHHRDTVMWTCFLHHLIPCDVLPWRNVTGTLNERIRLKLDENKITSSFILKYYFDRTKQPFKHSVSEMTILCNLYYRLHISETECLNSTYCLWPVRQVAATEAGGKGLAILFYAQMNSLSFLIIHQIFLLAHDWSTDYVSVTCKTAKHPFPAIFPNFQNCTCCKYLKDNKCKL